MTAKMLRRSVTWMLVVPVLAGALVGMERIDDGVLSVHAMQAQSSQPAATDEFVPVSELPPQEQLPALPLVAAAYAVAWVMIIGYVFTLWRRLGTVQKELADVTRRLGDRQRGA